MQARPRNHNGPGLGRPRLLLLLSLALLFLGLAGGAVSVSNTIVPAGIIIHHSAVPALPGGPAVDAAALEEIHRRRGFGIFYWGRVYHVGYHYVILPDGTVQKGRPDRCRGAHATGYNSYLGVCLVGNFSSARDVASEYGPAEPTPAQLDSLLRLCRRLQAEYGIPPERVLTHNEVNLETECPGDLFPSRKLAEELRR